MEDDGSSSVSFAEIISIFKSNSIQISEKNVVLRAIEQSKNFINEMPTETLQDNLMCYLMPCLKHFFFKLYKENSEINTIEHSQTLSENLKILIVLTDFVGYVIELVSVHVDSASISSLKVILLELPYCFQATYRHCKESQKKYQTLMEDCTEILVLYKKNQDFHMKYLDLLNSVIVRGDHQDDAKILIQVLQSILGIMEVLFGMNIKALADTWKIYTGIVEKYHEILISEAVYCVQEIQILIQQISSFMSCALENDENEKRRMQYIKLAGFLVKVGIKIVTCFWEHLQIDFFQIVHFFVCTVYDYSLEFLGQWTVDIQHCIQSNLLALISPFTVEIILSETFLKQLLANLDKLPKRGPGCMILDLKIMKFLVSQPSNEVDYISFNCFLDHIFADAAEHYRFLCESLTKTEDIFSVNLCTMISKCIEIHSTFYDGDLEGTLFSNIVGSNLLCHFLACEVWIQILSIATEDSRKEITKQLLDAIDKLNIDVSFSFPKSVLLARFMEKLFSIFSENYISDIIITYPPHDHLSLWMILGFSHVSINHKRLIDPLLSSLLSKLDGIEDIGSADEMIETVEKLKLISTLSFCFLETDGEKLLSLMQKLWGFSYEKINLENNFLKFFIANLSIATTGYIKYFSEDQIHCILKKMKALSTTAYFKLQLCDLLNAISTRTLEHCNGQNKLNFLISDLFEILLTENDEIIRKFSLDAFQQFSDSNQHIIVNNVSRILPNMNLEQYLRKKDDGDLNERMRKLEMAPLEHKCFKETSAKVFNKFPSNELLFAQESKAPVYQVPSTTKKSVLGYSRGIRSLQNKRIRLSEDVPKQDDSVNEVLQRIKSEIKCLKSVLVKESLTKKNMQDIRLLIVQLQNTIGSV